MWPFWPEKDRTGGINCGAGSRIINPFSHCCRTSNGRCRASPAGHVADRQGPIQSFVCLGQDVLQDSLLQQLLKQTALLTQLVCAPAAERQPSQAAAKEQVPEQAVVAAEQPGPSEPLSARERRQKRQGESLQKLEAEAAMQQKQGTPKTPQPALPRRQDSFHLPSRQGSNKSLGSQTDTQPSPEAGLIRPQPERQNELTSQIRQAAQATMLLQAIQAQTAVLQSIQAACPETRNPIINKTDLSRTFCKTPTARSTCCARRRRWQNGDRTEL